MRIGHASISENGTVRNGKAGDQTNKEVCVREYYDKNWKKILRCTDSKTAKLLAKICENLCNNKHIGYDQNGRNTLHNELKKLDYNYTLLEVDCECDCSSFMTVLAECVGIFPEYNQGNAPTTSTMVKAFTDTGKFKAIDFKSKNDLLAGDILVCPGSHTVMVLDDATKLNLARGIDVSSCQGKINWKEVKEDGISFAVLRSTKKNGSPDERFEANLKGCIDNRIDFSCYKYSYAVNEDEARIEASTVLKLLNNRKMTIWLDLEDSIQLATIGKDGVNKIAKAFIKRIQNAGFDIGIYCNLNWYNNVLDSELKSKYKIWLARYGKNTGILDLSYKPNKGEFAWQYSSRGRVNGIKGDVDLDVM